MNEDFYKEQSMKHKKTKGFFRAHKLICLVFLIFIYLITGATVPFMRFPELRPETVGDFEASAFRKGTPGVDRADRKSVV